MRNYEDTAINKADKELRRYIELDNRINGYEEHLQEIKRMTTLIKATDYSKDKVQGGEQGGLETKVASWIDLSIKIDENKRKLEELKLKMESALQRVEYPASSVLTMYYIKRMSIVAISRALSYSDVQIKRLKRQGLLEYGEKMKDDTK